METPKVQAEEGPEGWVVHLQSIRFQGSWASDDLSSTPPTATEVDALIAAKARLRDMTYVLQVLMDTIGVEHRAVDIALTKALRKT